MIGRNIRGGRGTAVTNQLDDASLDGVVDSAEWQALRHADRRATDQAMPAWTPSSPQATIWSEGTFARTVEDGARLVQAVTADAEAKQLMSAGYLESYAIAIGMLLIDVNGRKSPWYGKATQAQCSVTVRHPTGEGSGWAGLSAWDIQKVDEQAVARRALDKCVASLNPVRIEPGRYTAILEPQAVADLMEGMFSPRSRAMHRGPAEDRTRGASPFWFDYDPSVVRERSKLGLKIIDERITISHDPSDPEIGILPIPGMTPITWIKNGVLQELNHERDLAINELNLNEPRLPRSSFRMSGGTTSLEEMISTTKRGLIVTRFSSVQTLEERSLLATGVTRDGLWLVENGKITKSVRNFRFTESPLFVLNNVEQLGVPTPVFHLGLPPYFTMYAPAFALSPVIVPALKVNDFSFTSTIDAV
jgi:predicted Zn-dependent protease